jgi:tetratricopeptide (TPR) repeat protein
MMSPMKTDVLVLACLLVTVPASTPMVLAQATPAPGQSAEASTRVAFEALGRQADEARVAGRIDEAVALYKRAVAQQPSWTAGYWFLGTIYYDTDRHGECRDAFTHVVQQEPEHGAAWAFLGLCEFKLREYAAALDHLSKARHLGVGDDASFVAVVGYHRSILLARFEQFERAYEVDAAFVRGGNTSPEILDALGIAMLRLPLLPDEVPPERRELVRLAGRAAAYGIAMMKAEAREAFDQLVTRYPNTTGVHFLYGNLLLAQERPDEALEQFRIEIARSADHVPARLQLVQELLKRGEFEAATPYATEAARLAPGNFVARKVLGQIKLQAGDATGAIAELEEARTLEPSSPSVRFHLARAYQRAGRTADAERERTEFRRLEKLQQIQRGGANAAGGDLQEESPQ